MTFIAGLRHDKLVAPFVIEGPMNGETFLAYIEQCLAPTLRPGDIVIMDNVATNKLSGGVLSELAPTARSAFFTALLMTKPSR